MTAVTATEPAAAAPRRWGNMRRLFRDKLAITAAVLLVLLVLAAILAPWLAPNDPYLTNTRLRMLPPVWEARGRWDFLLGTDGLGRCMLSRLLYGLRATLMMGVIATVIGGSIGLLLGLFAAFYRRLDGVIMHLSDILLSFPAILLGLSFAAVVGPGMTAVVISLAVATIPTVVRVTRASALVVMGQDFIEAGRSIGLNDRTLLVRYLALNCISSVFVYLTLRFGQVILLGSALSFLGLGAQPPAAELGTMASAGRNELFLAPHIAVMPSLVIVVLVLCANVLGDALRDMLDPRLRHS
ncbi:ABC transporter permease [Phreatobacter cathodiphilus]|uniref:Glutathione ABC transporter permease GsiD n=1 Tax=Phreatobacter cathodiphilus TaxID=1868589 RepID=A0A2S0N6J8_9HYPH|nr:ABC transporter permease [Phreatobacter cathodiphilus]AVO43782.1 glutathione ABC transporter permease GsiD [Phreatobacter cathodiphilus]